MIGQSGVEEWLRPDRCARRMECGAWLVVHQMATLISLWVEVCLLERGVCVLARHCDPLIAALGVTEVLSALVR